MIVLSLDVVRLQDVYKSLEDVHLIISSQQKMSESELPIGYYLIKSKYAEGHVGICANGTHDRRLVMLTHQNAHGIRVSLVNP